MAQMYTKRVGVCVRGGSVCWKSTNVRWGGACVCGQWSIFFHIILAAYVGLIYIHGYPDNEAFNPGDPAVRTMNPITSCRLRDGMADSETDGRGCGRPAIQSHLSHSPVSLPPHPPRPSSFRAHIATYQQAKAKAPGSVCRTSHLPIAENLQPRGNARSSLYTVHYYLRDNYLTSNTLIYRKLTSYKN